MQWICEEALQTTEQGDDALRAWRAQTTGRAPPYALLRYGPDNLHQLIWDEEAEKELDERIHQVQTAMAIGGAKRNHDRPGKCQNCSRRYACSERLA